MTIKYTTQMGKNKMIIEFKHMSELHKFNAVYGNLPKNCDKCSSDNLLLSYKNPKGNDYYTLDCGDCTASANFGILKDGKGLFWKREKMEVYNKGNNSGGNGKEAGATTHNYSPQSENGQDWDGQTMKPLGENEEVPFEPEPSY